MRPLCYSINITIDGCVDHEAVSPDEESHADATRIIAQADGLLFGRVVYEMMEGAWRPSPDAPEMPEWTAPFARTIDAAKKYVVSDTLESVDWNADLIRGDELEARVRALKEEPGEGLYTGGVTLPLALANLGLIDEYEFLVHPRLVGRGPRVFEGLSNAVDLELVERRDFRSGAVSLRYVPRG